jgi:hypothetical protein
MIVDLLYKISDICFKEKLVDMRYTIFKKDKRIIVILSYDKNFFDHSWIDYDNVDFCIKHMTKRII